MMPRIHLKLFYTTLILLNFLFFGFILVLKLDGICSLFHQIFFLPLLPQVAISYLASYLFYFRLLNF